MAAIAAAAVLALRDTDVRALASQVLNAAVRLLFGQLATRDSLSRIPLDRVAERYDFENDLLVWLNIADVNDFMVAQPWLKGVEQAHVVTNPNSLRLNALSVG